MLLMLKRMWIGKALQVLWMSAKPSAAMTLNARHMNMIPATRRASIGLERSKEMAKLMPITNAASNTMERTLMILQVMKKKVKTPMTKTTQRSQMTTQNRAKAKTLTPQRTIRIQPSPIPIPRPQPTP